MGQNKEVPNGVLSPKNVSVPVNTVERLKQANVAAPKDSTAHESDPSLAWKQDGNLYNQGPDQFLKSSAIYTWHADGAVKTNQLGSGDASQRPFISVPSFLESAAQRAPDRRALVVKRNGNWQTWTFKKYLEDVRTAAKGFIALGLERFHSVCILGFNAPEWFISDLAAIYAGGFAAGIYTTNSAEACAFVVKDSKAQIVVVENAEQLGKILQHKNELTDLKAIIQYTGQPTETGVHSWAELMALGKEQTDEVLTERLKHIAINQCCTLIYTSGTTGNPKGVMLSHDNMTWSGRNNCEMSKLFECQETFLSYLPLSHVAAQITDIYSPLAICCTVYFADRNALKGSLVEEMKEAQITGFFAVPRVWEKIYEKMQEVGSSASWLKKRVAGWAKSKGLEYNMKRSTGIENPSGVGFHIANKLILSKVREALGLTKCHLHISGGAPIKPEILKYFMSLNIFVTEIYGMSESSGGHCFGIEPHVKLGSVGKSVPGAVTKLASRDETGNGELCMGGRNVLMGYLNRADMTKDSIDREGWFHTGDIGKVDTDGYVYITGRIKEIIITAGGENVAPIPIEENVQTALPAAISQVMLLGDKQRFLSVLLTLKTEVDKDTLEPLDILQPLTKDWICEVGECEVSSVQDVLKQVYEKKNEKLIAAFQAGIDEANTKAVSRAQIIQKWHILPVDFSIPGGEFGPTLKLRRAIVSEKYQHIIDNLYLPLGKL